MSPKPQITLSIPAFFQPLELWKKDFGFDVASNYFSLLLTSLEFIDVQKVHGLSACFYSSLGWNSGEIPAAYYRAVVHLGQNQDHFLNHDSYRIMCADPVHLEVGMKDVTLTEQLVDLTETDAKEVIALLNQHFQADDLQFLYGSEQHWYVIFPKSESIRTTPLEDVINKNIVASLPFSEQRNWQQIQNEIQMLLHSSDLNKRRETAGLIPLNSLWFWGGGEPKKLQSDLEKVFSSDESSLSEIQGKMFARSVNCRWQKLPVDSEKLLTHLDHKPGKYFILLDQLQQPAREENLEAYQTALSSIEEHYIKPLMKAWQSHQIDLVIDAADGSLIRPLQTPFWKFWSKPRPLIDVAVMITQKKLIMGNS